MDVLSFRDYCLSLPLTEESTPFDETTLVYKIGGKMYACADMNDFGQVAVKCDPDEAVRLRERYEEIGPAYHFNKTHWNGIRTAGDLLGLGGAKIAGAESNGRVFIKPRSGGECERPAGEWNCAEIVCVGDHIAVCVNGVLQNECTGSVRSGYIALQSEGGPVEFRNIWLTRLRRGI